MPLIPKTIMGIDAGLTRNKKPAFIPDKAWQTLENAYVWRDRCIKRKGLKLLGRLRRAISMASIGTSGASPWTVNIFSGAGLVGTITGASKAVNCEITSPNHNLPNGASIVISGVVGMTQLNGNTYTITVVDANNFTIGVDSTTYGAYVSGGSWVDAIEVNEELQPGSVTITIGAIVFTDNGNGTLSSVTPGNSGHISYITGIAVLTHTAGAGVATTTSFHYYPSLPVMGIPQREIAAINDEQTIWFDEKYAYVWNGASFDEFISGTTWASTNSDFFWAFNYRGTNPQDRLFFVTNFISNASNPMRYTDGITWTTFAPLVSASTTLFSARILVAYYGRLLALNVYEGLTATGPGGAVNIFNRCRFSQLGSPIQSDAWQSDIFGKGGFIDAPTNEAITGATFIKNTLVVDFERTTWQLRYVGEYGLPFIWERISADFGSESTFSGVLFDNHRLAVGDKAITGANGVGVDRIDLAIPDQVFSIQNVENGVKRVFGVRDYRNELVYWNYPDGNTQAVPGVDLVFPNKVLLYNYRNNTWAIFRDSITAFGTFQLDPEITWDSTDIFWDDEEITWDGLQGEEEALDPEITAGNQQGFIFLYNYQTPDEASLSITGIDLSANPIVVTCPNHNLQTGEVIYIQGMNFLNNSTFVPFDPGLNNAIYAVQPLTVNTFSLLKYNFTTKSYSNNFFTPISTALYVGGGTIALFPRLNIIGKDFSLFAERGLQTKVSHIDFLVEVTPTTAMTVNLLINATRNVIGNVKVGNTSMSTSPTPPFYPPSQSSDYAWYSFYATTVGQFFSINITYDDGLMNTLSTHNETWGLLGINAWVRPGGGMTH